MSSKEKWETSQATRDRELEVHARHGETIHTGPVELEIGAQADLPTDALGFLKTDNRNLTEFSAYVDHSQSNLKYQAPNRKGFANIGQPTKIGLNAFDITQLPSKKIYQYDVTIGNGHEKRALIKKVWFSEPVQSQLDPKTMFDGNKLAWGTKPFPKEVKIVVDLDEIERKAMIAAGREPRRPRKGGRKDDGDDDPNDPYAEDRKKNIFRCFIRSTKVVNFDSLWGYLAGRSSFDITILDSINFLDHLLRESPSQRMTAIKRSFFSRPEQVHKLKDHLEAWKGVFATLKMVYRTDGPGLTVNVDVSNGVFWRPMGLQHICMYTAERQDLGSFGQDFQKFMHLTMGKGADPTSRQERHAWTSSEMYGRLKKLRKVSVRVRARGTVPAQIMMINEFPGWDSRTYSFEWTDYSQGKEGKKVWTNLREYMKRKHNEDSFNHMLPVVEMTKRGTVLPIEFCEIMDCQRYPFKLDERETSEMMKFAVQPPPQRWAAIQEGVNKLDWQRDTYLNYYGMKINSQRTTVQARILPPPDLAFGNGKHPGKMVSTGRWRIDGKHFMIVSKTPIISWGFFCVPGRGKASHEAAQRFADKFTEVWKKHGGNVPGKPVVADMKVHQDFGNSILECWNVVGNKFQKLPQLLIFIMPFRDATMYYRIKKSTDCRFGVPCQVIQSTHVQKCQEQYISNVLMKVNAKLQGSTSRAMATDQIMTPIKNKYKDKTTRLINQGGVLIIGADVSHASPGSALPSTMALTMSLNSDCSQYMAVCNTNGFRVEIIRDDNMYKLKQPIFNWMTRMGGRMPVKVIYLRDGVSEPQYQFVLEQEVSKLKDVFLELHKESNLNTPLPKFIVMVASKRHHVRFFPEHGDKNKNPLPGTVVDKGVTHPFQEDFYLCAHQAIKGTARPVHYHLLLNELEDLVPDELQQFLYMHSYQYCRSTTPVSLHPAVYYAHLASMRSKAHEKQPSAPGTGIKGVWQQELDKRIAKRNANSIAAKASKPLPYTDQETRTDTKAIHEANVPGIPKSFDPNNPDKPEAKDERASVPLMEIGDKNYKWFPESMFYV